MKKGKNENKFQAEQDTHELERQKQRTWSWVSKMEITALFVVFYELLNYAQTTGGWKGWLAGVVAVGILSWFISAVFDRIMRHVEARDKEINLLRRQMTAFVCDVSLGQIEKRVLERLAMAVSSITGKGQKNNLRVNDFSLISRVWHFWKEQTGFEW